MIPADHAPFAQTGMRECCCHSACGSRLRTVLIVALRRAASAVPRLVMTNFRPPIRDRVEQAYRDVEAHPSDAAANGRLAMLLHAFEQYDSAEALYRRTRALEPRGLQWAYYLGLVQALNGKNQEAAASLREASAIDPNYLPVRVKLMEVLLTLRRFDEGDAFGRAIVKEDPRIAPAYYWLGRIAAANGQPGAAAEFYRTACRLWPTYGTAHYALALASRQAGDENEARREMAAYEKHKSDGDPQLEDPLLEAVRALDNTALAHLMKGVDLENAGKIDEAIAEHEEAVKLDPRLAQAHANLIGLYARRGAADRVEQEYRATLAINPNLPQSHYDYGVFLVSRERFREAEAAFRKAIESSPEYAEAHSNLGADARAGAKLR